MARRTLLLALCSVLLLTGCNAVGVPDTSEGTQTPEIDPADVEDYATLRTFLLRLGPTADAGEITQPFFTPKGHIIVVQRAAVQVYEYEDEDTARSEAGAISRDASTAGTMKISWLESPHFYRKGRLVVLYVGENANVVQALAGALGTPFAEL